METKRFLFGIIGGLALVSCSNDDVVSVNHDGDEIAFHVVTNAVTRAENVYCNNHKPSQFMVHAKLGPSNATYIDEDVIAYAEGKWVNQNGIRYWPDDGDVTFYAHHNAGNEVNWGNESSSPTVSFTVESQKDFIYAKKTQSKPDNGQVILNFRHALSQIVFNAKNTNPNLYVEIYGVSVCNVKGQGTFTYPSGSNTDVNMADETDDNDDSNDHDGTFSQTIDYNDGSWGKWAIDKDATQEDYTVELTEEKVVKLNGSKAASAVSLTNNTGNDEFNTNAMLLLPQELTPWDAQSTPSKESGTYFRVKCNIYNVSGPSYVSGDVLLWGNEGENNKGKDIAIPATTMTWEQGKKYIYTFVFGDGNGGYDPDPDGPTPPDPVLLPITFEVKVDDFVSNTDTEKEIPMDKPANQSETQG